MARPTVLIKVLRPQQGQPTPAPARMSEHAAGFDVAAAIDAPMTLGAGERALVPCGFSMAVPPGFEAQVRPRSGLALKHGISILNAPGTIDADYRGEVKVLLVNMSDKPYQLAPGERIAQIVFAPVVIPELNLVNALDPTPRGENGFGSTGR
jgi:dUTP pyrophosphatase